jgi:hypothetical protein
VEHGSVPPDTARRLLHGAMKRARELDVSADALETALRPKAR